MQYRIERKVSFLEIGYIDAENEEDLKEKLKTAKLEWDVDFDFDPQIDAITVYDEDCEEICQLPPDTMKEDYVGGMNGCIIFNREEFENHI